MKGQGSHIKNMYIISKIVVTIHKTPDFSDKTLSTLNFIFLAFEVY